ncbi:MAG: class I SAM-dependent methyltransferase [Kofleriaceae bacterium]|nr:class I SAM-dependent methyltransferase [Kofleriaceae bacterium]
MSEYKASTYGDRFAEFYDLLESASLDTEGTVAKLSSLASEGPILELGIGTGRVALPLQEGGLEVHGVEASEAMIAKLRAKEGGDKIRVIQGDFSKLDYSTKYSLAFAAYNTFSSLPDQDSQVQCLEKVTKALSPDGVLVLESAVPDSAILAKGQDVQVRFVDADLLVLHASRYDSIQQRAIGQSIIVANGVIHTFPVQTRYNWPSELDLMARIAGLSLVERWANWRDEPFDAGSKSYISVYRRK